ncbi:hypothetical protein [Mesorhizobium sp. A623]
MADTRTARPVSGEIMAGTATERTVPPATGDIIDADYEILPQLGERAPASQPPSPRSTPTPSVEGMDMLRRRDGAPAPRRTVRGGPIFWIAGVGAAIAAFWVSGGHALVRQAPLFAPARQVQATFSLTGVKSRVDGSGAKPLLFVDGEAANDGTDAAPLPPLVIKVTGTDERITRYTLGTAGYPLAPGERFAFSSRLDVPKNGVKTVSVIFAE